MMAKKKNSAPAVHIPLEHQASPKKNWADKEVEKAAEEIRTGQFTPESSGDDELLSVGLQRGALPGNPNLIDMQATRDSLALAQHPRVIAALARLEQEKNEARNSQEAIEKSQMIFELNEVASDKNRWDGQQRWLGAENEEARIGLILTPFQFMERLEKVIGKERVSLNRFAVLNRVALLVKNDATAPIILMPGQEEPSKDPFVQVGTLQWPCSSEWMILRFDEYGVPTDAKYLGWRTALLSMVNLGVITEKEANKAFPLGSGPAASWYKEQMFMFREKRGQIN